MPTNPYDQFDNIPPATTPKQARRTEQEAIEELDTSIADPVDDNPYDQFDGHEQGRELQPWEILPQWMANWGADSAQVLKGVGTTLAPWNWGQTTKQITDMAGGFPMMALTPEAQEAITADNPRAAEMRAAAKAVIDQYGENYSNPGKFLFEHPAQFGMDLSSLVALGPAAGIRAAAGRVPNALQDAALIAANPTRAVEGPAQMAGHGVRAVANMMNPQRNLLLRAAEGQESDIINHLRAAQEIVPGSAPTTAQAISQMPNPPIQTQVLLNDAAKRNPTGFANRGGDQNAARLAAVDAVVPHPDLPAAIASRDAQAAQDYAAAFPVMSTSDDVLAELFNRPVMGDVFGRARVIAQNHGREFPIGDVPEQVVDSTVLGPNGQPIQMTIPAERAQYSGQDLHTVKQAFDDESFAKAQEFGIDSAETRAIRDARNEFLTWFENNNPAYAAARRNYANASGPIEQTRLLNYYRAKLANPLTGDDAARLNAMGFTTARDNAMNDATVNASIRKATGQRRYFHERDLLTPEQMTALDQIQADLARAKMAEEQARTPNSYAGELGNASEGASAPGFLSPAVTVFNYLARMMQGRVNQGVANRLAEAAPNPEQYADLLEEAIASRARLDRASVPFQAVGRGVQAINRFPAGYNALQYDRDGRTKDPNARNHL